MAYNWDLIERLLHEAQNCANKPYVAATYAEELAEELRRAGEDVGSIEALQQEAQRYQEHLLAAGFMAPRPTEEGGNGKNFVLTQRGSQLLSMIDSSIPGGEHERELLDEQGGAALEPKVFEEVAAKANLL